MFQFLIGRLKTALTSDRDEDIEKFQFLIGRLKTIEAKKEEMLKNLFQFLIGRLKTQLRHVLHQKAVQVSIPYR